MALGFGRCIPSGSHRRDFEVRGEMYKLVPYIQKEHDAEDQVRVRARFVDVSNIHSEALPKDAYFRILVRKCDKNKFYSSVFASCTQIYMCQEQSIRLQYAPSLRSKVH